MNAPTAVRQVLRVGSRQTPRVSARMTQQARQISNKDDLGGPGGQEPPPPKPEGPEAIKRNGVLYAGIGLTAIAAYAYLTQPKETQQMAGKAIHAGQKAKEAGKQELEDTKEELQGSMEKMSGRAKEGQKGFRSE